MHHTSNIQSRYKIMRARVTRVTYFLPTWPPHHAPADVVLSWSRNHHATPSSPPVCIGSRLVSSPPSPSLRIQSLVEPNSLPPKAKKMQLTCTVRFEKSRNLFG